MIQVDHLTVRVGGFELRNISFAVPAGAHAFLMGRTGSGKTTLLEAICGLRRVESGRIWVGSADVTQLPPGQRGIGFVPQDAALFEHLSVREHLAFALQLRGWTADAVEARVAELAEWLELRPLLHRRPHGLSGGEIQRVALGRALSFRPSVLCLDEPLSAMDDDSREQMLAVLQNLRDHAPVTVLHITHSHRDAAKLADRILQLREGRLIAPLDPMP